MALRCTRGPLFVESKTKTAALLIAHGSRRDEANRDLARLADELRAENRYDIVEIAYLELCAPTIIEAGRSCVARGAERVVMVPYFLSAGAHVVDDLERFRGKLHAEFPAIQFALARPLSPHPLLLKIVMDRLNEAESA